MTDWMKMKIIRTTITLSKPVSLLQQQQHVVSMSFVYLKWHPYGGLFENIINIFGKIAVILVEVRKDTEILKQCCECIFIF